MPIRLLATKLYVPPLRSESVPRPRLLDRLEAGLRRAPGVVLVSAPAGYGKTTLLSEWHASPRGRDVPLAWVLLDEQDNDPVRFWSYVLAALEKVHPGIGGGARTLLQALPSPDAAAVRDESRALQGMLTALVNDLVSAPAGDALARPLVLALDDYHTIHNPAIHDALAFFLDYLPPALHVVLLTRADPPLPLARLRARDQLLELRAADLRFTAGEVDLFLNQVMALDLPAGAVSTLDAHTEGWAAGLQLAALSLQGLDPRQAQRFIEAFAGTHRHILTYLTEEVLQRQSPEMQAFLLRTSILPYLTAPLCDAVTGQPGSQPLLEQLANDNLFTTLLDAEGRWYRYHPLFADTLRSRLRQSSPDLVPVLHRRASAWHQEQGPLVDAVRHALVAGDPTRAAHLVEAGYKRLIMRGELVTLHRWLDALPVELVQARPRLCLASALTLAYSGRRELSEGYLQQAETALASAAETTNADIVRDADIVRGEIAALRAVLASVNWAGPCSPDLARQALQLLPAARSDEDRWLRILTLKAQGNCLRFQGEVREAAASYVEALAAARALNSPFLIQAVTNRLGQNQLLQGRLRQAAQTFEAALRQAEDQGGELMGLVGELHAHLGRVYTEWNELDRALPHIQRGIELSRQAENQFALLEGYLALAGVQNAWGQVSAVDQALEEAQQLAVGVGGPYLGAQVAAQQAWLRLSAVRDSTPGDTIWQWAEGWAARRTQPADEDLPLILREFQDLTLARFQLMAGRHNEARELLAAIQPAAQAAGRMDTVLRAIVLRALVYQQQDDPALAQDTLRRALALAEPEGYVRLFLDEGNPMQLLITDLRLSMTRVSDALLAYVDRLLAAFPEADTPRTRVQNRLTAREMEILMLMADGASNQEIAGRLVVTVGTVKGHINHILDKLEARNRTQAVARARELGLLEH
ncbi:MAG: LuxR C-terminal-related transcriptional regulator [Chloroflexi bacterium]|nr:LuxR C-terminal-related transcriptional regulator [Chloroflexota bacterium]MBU1751243.1 LuxR C-terminal-related transcriptional regulator [Chloroflexota bacterium]MBU1877784.1 LuxR C-terminal-related transcriptional regulator [Chloroflexota bacterium]